MDILHLHCDFEVWTIYWYVFVCKIRWTILLFSFTYVLFLAIYFHICVRILLNPWTNIYVIVFSFMYCYYNALLSCCTAMWVLASGFLYPVGCEHGIKSLPTRWCGYGWLERSRGAGAGLVKIHPHPIAAGAIYMQLNQKRCSNECLILRRVWTLCTKMRGSDRNGLGLH